MVNTAQMIFRLAFAALAGALIGYERQMKGHPLGIRTNVLVCVSATTVMMLSKAMVAETFQLYGMIADPRLAQQVITGIGFLGAGTIMHSDSNVKGLTTAASLWSVGCIGLVIGAGFYQLAAVVTVLVFIVLLIMNYISNFFQRRVQHRNISLSIEPQLDIFLAVISHLKDCGVNIDRADAQIDTWGENKRATIDFSVRGIKQAQKIIKSLESVEGILNIKYNS